MARDDDLKDDAQASLADRSPPEPGEIYQHYKGGLYVVVCCSVQEDCLEHLVTYRSNRRGICWTRRLATFVGSVTIGPHEEVPRFRRVLQ